MRTVIRYQKTISLIVLVSLYWLCMPQLPAHAAMVSTEDVINQGSNADFDRVRIKEFLSRNDIIAQLQSYGISSEEALSRVDSLTDQEIALIIGKIDKLPAGGDAAAAFASSITGGISNGAGVLALYLGIAAVIITIVVLIIMSALGVMDREPNKPNLIEMEETPKTVAKVAPTKTESKKISYPFNPEEPWTGVWDVQGHINWSGKWVLKQIDNKALSTEKSLYQIEGLVVGDQLKGKIITPRIRYSFTVNISSDGQYFEGTSTDNLDKNFLIRGTRKAPIP